MLNRSWQVARNGLPVRGPDRSREADHQWNNRHETRSAVKVRRFLSNQEFHLPPLKTKKAGCIGRPVELD
jgi:hypothetical protein